MKHASMRVRSLNTSIEREAKRRGMVGTMTTMIMIIDGVSLNFSLAAVPSSLYNSTNYET